MRETGLFIQNSKLSQMINTSWKTVTNHKSTLGEGPLWDEINERIIWLDILKGRIHFFTPSSEQYDHLDTGQLTGAVTLTSNGALLAAMQNGFYTFDEHTKKGTFLADPESHLPDNRFNDGKCDPSGRFWAGTMHVPETETTGNLYMLSTDGQIIHKVSGVGCSNGLAWNSAQDTMYYIDSPTREVVAYHYDAETGDIRNLRTVLTIPEGGGFPDGMTIDSEDKLWVALWDGWKIIRVDPDTGQVIDQIDLPVARITSAAFGGKDFRDLYITSARVGLTEEQLAQQPLAGSLFVVEDVGVRGLPAFRYKAD
jgi:sugar lactone lactonase YvrE